MATNDRHFISHEPHYQSNLLNVHPFQTKQAAGPHQTMMTSVTTSTSHMSKANHPYQSIQLRPGTNHPSRQGGLPGSNTHQVTSTGSLFHLVAGAQSSIGNQNFNSINVASNSGVDFRNVQSNFPHNTSLD